MNTNTTPRKVKQESRLRRSLSLTNTNRSNNSSTELDENLNGTSDGTSPSINYLNQDGGAFSQSQNPQQPHLPQPESGEVERNNSESQSVNVNLYQANGLHVLPPPPPPPPSFLQSSSQQLPPPYRAPPALSNNSGPFPSFHDLPNSVPDYSTYQTHSSKFPIVREVVFSKESGREPHPQSKIPSLSQYHKIQNRKLTTKQIAWTDERKAFTLDSRTAKEFQERLLSSPSTLTRRNSLDLETFLKVFNEEQSTLMASMQGGRINNMEGVDNPALDLGSMSHGHSHSQSNAGLYTASSSNKLSGYFPDSSNSQSLSLSSSNADSMDTVIYKGPAQPSPSIRDWQRSIDSNLERPIDFNHRSENNNSFRDATVFVDSRSYQMQQASAYQPLQFNGPGGHNGNLGMNGHGNNNNFTIEYHRGASQQAQQHHQNLSVQSIPSSGISSNNNGTNNHSSSNHNHHSNSSNTNNSIGNNASNNGMSVSNLNALRAGNNSITTNNNNNNSNGGGGSVSTPNGSILSQSYGSNPQLSSKSPLLTQKQFSPVPTSSSAAVDLNQMLENKASAKDSSKLFHTKTYNHIKDMISSRFGAAAASANGSSNSKSVNSANANNNSNNNGGVINEGKPLPVANGLLNNSSSATGGVNSGNSALPSSAMNSYTDGGYVGPSSPNQHYGLQQQQQQQQQLHHHSVSAQNTSNSYNSNAGAYYSATPPTPSPSGYTVGLVNGGSHHHSHGMLNGTGPPNSYRSPPMNDRKNVNTSFRKAIQKSTQKSNLIEESVPQMRSIMEASNSGLPLQQHGGNQNINRDLYRSSQYNGTDQLHQLHQQHLGTSGTGIGIHAERAQRALDKLCEAGVLGGQVGPFHRTGSGPIVHPHSHQQQSAYPNNRLSLSHNQYSSGLAAAASDSRNQNQPSPGLAASSAAQHISDNLHSRHKFNVKASLGSPSSGLAVLDNAHSVSYSKSGGITNEAFQGNDEYDDSPPPLPTSQQPGIAQLHQQQQQLQQDINTVGLPVLAEQRENGDGSSGSMEATKLNGEPGMIVGGDHLKQITTELQNLAMSVANHNNHSQAEHQSSSSECEKGSQRVGSGQSHTTTDSGHGTVLLAKSPLHSSDPSEPLDALISQRQKFNENIADSISSGNDSEWVDIVEPEIRQILEMERANKSVGGKVVGRTTNTSNSLPDAHGTSMNHIQSQSNGNHKNIQAINGQNYNQGNRSHLQSQIQGHSGIPTDPTSPTPLSKKSPALSPKLPKKFDLNTYNKKSSEPLPGTSQQAIASMAAAKAKSPRTPANVHRSNSNSGSGQNQRLNAWSSRQRLSNEKGKSSSRNKESSPHKSGKLTRSAMSQILYSLNDDNGDITSTTTGLDLESMLDGPTENTSDDDDLSTTIDTTDAHAIRRQLESLEGMYTEVLKVLGARKFSGNRYPSSDLRNAKRRPYGSMSSLPSSVSSRPFREKKKVDDKKKVKDLKSINRRFQRLESHVVTLARSVAHLSSEMRTQHLMVQEMESIRNEMSQLRSQVAKSMQAHANGGFARVASGRNGAMPHVNSTDWQSFRNALPSLTNPNRVRKLTKFFGDEPPLIRIFLKKLGYEKYATAFEQERIGIMELPYLTEERLNKMGIPMGPRLRILQEAHMCLRPHHHDSGHASHHNNHNTGNLSVYVV